MRHAIVLCLVAACSSHAGGTSPGTDAPGSGSGGIDGSDGSGGGDAPVTNPARTVFVITLENKDSTKIYANTADAPYVNGLMTGPNAIAAYATKFADELANGVPSEPHYVWMEAGTNVFTDHTFSTDDDASAANSTNSTAHLSTQLTTAHLSWTAYQEDIATGDCPITSTYPYAAKHDPFVFFQDVIGSPAGSAPGCGEHHKVYGDLAADLANGTVPNYAFITPNLCDDMHGDPRCGQFTASQEVSAGDTWLQTNLPPIITYSHTHDAIIFLVWDEGSSTQTIPFLAIGDHVVKGMNTGAYTHSSQIKTIEKFLGLPVLAKVASATDFSTMFDAGYIAP